MFQKYLDRDVQSFINDHIGRDVKELALKKNPFPKLDWKIILNQIESKNKAQKKLPTWFSAENIIYPPKVSIEQTSSESTAKYKSNLVQGNLLVDVSGGWGVDDFYFSSRFKSVIHCEKNEELSAIARHNFKMLKVQNIDCINEDSFEVLRQLKEKVDCIYADPSRRHSIKGKVFLLKDCEPDVTSLTPFYFSIAETILIKTAPLLDINSVLSELSNVYELHIVAVDNEVKELLWILKKNYNGSIRVYTVNIKKETIEGFDFILEENDNSLCRTAPPEKFLYEPNAAVMKSGGFLEIQRKFGVMKLHSNSHLFTSKERISFCGRAFEIKRILPYTKETMKKHLKENKAHITTRNFPESVETIRKKWKIKDGGDDYYFFTTDLNNNKIVLLCTKIENE